MAILAGIDEAGLGPRLGPLVSGLTVFQGPEKKLGELAEILRPVVGPDVGFPVPVGDSKRLYGSRKSLSVLERGLYPFLARCTGSLPEDLHQWIQILELPGERVCENIERYPWYRDRLPLPRSAGRETLHAAGLRLEEVLTCCGIRFLEIRLSVLHAGEVNKGLRQYVSKNVLNFFAVAPFLRRVFDAYGDQEDVELVVDRQGGRKDYEGLLRTLFYPASVSPRPAPEGMYSYGVHGSGRRIGICFVTRADSSFLPVSLASMVAKYTRELHMILFNRFWQNMKPELRPTAGYPQDARRFLEEIKDLRHATGVGTDRLIRVR